MGTKQHKLDELKGKNPFKTPYGYMEGLTDQIMNRLPEVPYKEVPKISLLDRVRPWLYMAAVFVGLLLLFRGFISLQPPENNQPATNEPSYYTTVSTEVLQIDSEEDREYLEYLESEYLSGAFSEMLANAE